jgi:hypothetical protein
MLGSLFMALPECSTALLKHMVIQELELWNELLREAKSSLKIPGNVEFRSRGKIHEVKNKG